MTNAQLLEVPLYDILIVDDDRASIEAYKAILSRGHCYVHCVDSGDKALRLLLDREFALVVLDIQMPGMNGFEVAHFMRARARTRDIPVLFITAHDSDIETQSRAYDLGGIDFLLKPLNGELFLAKVSVLLKLYHSRAQLAEANRALSEERAYYAAILNTAAEGIIVIDAQGRIQYANPVACQLLEFRPSELYGSVFEQRLQNIEGNIIPWENGLLKCMDQPGRVFRSNDINLLNSRDEAIAVRLSGAPLRPSYSGYVLVFLDNRPSKALQCQLEQLVVTDALTGLLNRSGFLNTLTAAVDRSSRSGQGLAVMYLDLDGFKHINDSMGHAQGDYLLRKISERLKVGVRASDTLARIGGDEFTILLEQLPHVEDAARIAEKLLSLIEAPINLDLNEMQVSASIGIATYPDCGDNVETLLKAADIAMYQAKNDGRNQYRFFTEEMNGRARTRFMLQESLRHAIQSQEFFLQYQPQVSLSDGHIRGFEALLRWQHPRAGLVSPATFIPLLEETLLINTVGNWVADEAWRAAKRLNAQLTQSATISINLSAKQFNNRDLASHILRLIERHQLAPELVELEVTESALMHDVQFSVQVLSTLRSHGIKIALDDFGTGYSSLGYLRQFEIDVLKIDRVFLQNALHSSKDAAIVKTIVELSHVLDMKVVAEGVETLDQVRWLTEIGCDYAQGFYFAKPLDEQAAAQFSVSFPFFDEQKATVDSCML